MCVCLNISIVGPVSICPLFGLVYAGIHCSIWNQTFGSISQAVVWRVCGVLFFACPIIYLFFCIFIGSLTSWKLTLALLIELYLWIIVALLRAFSFVLAFASFWRQPGDVYVEVDWSQFFPFLS